jgi:hypothetical protein
MPLSKLYYCTEGDLIMAQVIEKSRRYAVGGLKSVVSAIIVISVFMISSVLPNGLLAGTSNKVTVPNNAAQEQKKGAPSKTPRTIVMDSHTGYTVYPEEIQIKDRETKKVVYQKVFTKEEQIKYFRDGVITQAFLSSLPLPPGPYDCRLSTKNYTPMTVHCRIGAQDEQSKLPDSSDNQIGKTIVNLEPIEKPRETSHEVLRPLQREDSALIVGFIVDDDLGLPMPDVAISTLDRSITAKSNDRGFFMIRIPLPKEYEDFPRIHILFEKERYVTLEKDYVLMPYGSWIIRIRLVPGQGKIKELEGKYERHGTPD